MCIRDSISIAPAYQRTGCGTILLRHSMEKAKELGAGALAITGNIGFYGKSGFVVASSKGIHYYAEQMCIRDRRSASSAIFS